tara:strand:- start:3876 stop:4268 length:393 start_codon:yes stop_codon:yes gene_type:complete
MAGTYKVRFKMRGNRQLREKLEDLARRTPVEAGKSLLVEGKYQLSLAEERTPYLSGALASSARIAGPVVDGDDVIVALGFGGASNEIPYAMAQHQRSYTHTRGEKKWLSATVKRERGRMLRRIAKEFKLI